MKEPCSKQGKLQGDSCSFIYTCEVAHWTKSENLIVYADCPYKWNTISEAKVELYTIYN